MNEQILSKSLSDPAVSNAPLICFSHLRWDFVLQRPQHLMSRFARNRQIYFFEEYIPTDHHSPYLEYHPYDGSEVISLRPRLPHHWNEAQRVAGLRQLLDQLLRLHAIKKPLLWFYSPVMFAFARHIDAGAVVYDCMDELANFRFAPPGLKALEGELMARADVVFTGGSSLFDTRRHLHDNIHLFPSGVELEHFRAARGAVQPAADMASLPGKKLGFYGVIDERVDLPLLAALAASHPDWSIVMVGPLAKIAPHDLPRAPNLHFMGPRAYADLPACLAAWDVALMPFAINEATRFISPTKTPEYLAAGLPVVSTPIVDVAATYHDIDAVRIAATPATFIAACEAALAGDITALMPQVEQKLATMSWDETFRRMSLLVEEALRLNDVRTTVPAYRRKSAEAPQTIAAVAV